MDWRFIDIGEVDPPTGPAVFEAVMDARQRKAVGDTLLFWRPKTPAVYIGFHQRACEDIDLEACRRHGIPVIRRILGGGSGYCDRDQVIYNAIFEEDGSGIGRGPKAVYLHTLRGVIEALRILGINEAGIDEERYGVTANGRKISGSGQLSAKGVVNTSGSFLVGFDFMMMKKCLKDPLKNLRPGIEEPEEGMTCLRNELGRDVSMNEASFALRKGFEHVLGKMREEELSAQEKKQAEILREKYMGDEWTFRADNRKDRRK